MFDPQLLLFLKAFSETEQTKLAMLSGILLGSGTLPATILTSLFTDSLVKEGTYVHFLPVSWEKKAKEKYQYLFLVFSAAHPCST